MLVPMTLSDLERQNARSQIFPEDLCNFACTVWHRMTTFGQVRHGEGHFYAVSATSSSWGGMLEQHSRFHDASPGRTICCSPQCRVKSKVERFEIALDCPKPVPSMQTTVGQPLGWRQSTGRRSVDWMLVAHASGPLRLQPELYAQTAWGGVVLVGHTPSKRSKGSS